MRILPYQQFLSITIFIFFTGKKENLNLHDWLSFSLLRKFSFETFSLFLSQSAVAKAQTKGERLNEMRTKLADLGAIGGEAAREELDKTVTGTSYIRFLRIVSRLILFFLFFG